MSFLDSFKISFLNGISKLTSSIEYKIKRIFNNSSSNLDNQSNIEKKTESIIEKESVIKIDQSY